MSTNLKLGALIVIILLFSLKKFKSAIIQDLDTFIIKKDLQHHIRMSDTGNLQTHTTELLVSLRAVWASSLWLPTAGWEILGKPVCWPMSWWHCRINHAHVFTPGRLEQSKLPDSLPGRQWLSVDQHHTAFFFLEGSTLVWHSVSLSSHVCD